MSDVDQINALSQVIRRIDGSHTMSAGALAEAILERRTEWDTHRIIRTVEELEALDGFVWLMCRDGIPITAGQLIRAIREYGPRHYLPAAVVLTDTQIHAARNALEEA